ncbi:MAG: SMC-Scp complex subunit ScpB [Beijerinckiaceae bacterium]
MDDGDVDSRFSTALRIVEALVFASREPVDEKLLAEAIPAGVALADVLAELGANFAGRGVNLVQTGGKWLFRTAADLSWLMSETVEEPRKLSRVAMETLAIIAYHQPVTRAEIEEIRGVATARGTLDVLLETGWVRMRGRRKTPGRPITLGTGEGFLLHFGLNTVTDLPGLEELRAAGMFDGRLMPGLAIPLPSDDPVLRADEDPLDGDPLTLAIEERINEGDEPLQDESSEEEAAEETETDVEDEEPLDPITEERQR